MSFIKRLHSQSLLALICLIVSSAHAEDRVIVNPGVVLRTGADRVVGINLNYIRDHDENRQVGARPISDALKEMGCRWLRYPGGEKSDFHLWSTPPYQKPQPISLGWYKQPAGKRIDFDHYIELAKKVGATPYVVVAYDSEKRTGTTKDTFLENAVSLLQYANQIKKYGVQYWEIGNENWHNETGSAEELAEVVMEFSAAMKMVDPSIKIGASGSNQQWWTPFLQKAAPSIDFVSLSLYNAWEWGGYDYYPSHPENDLIRPVNQTLHAIDALPEEHRKRLRVIVAETNSKDYSQNGWTSENSIGHAVVTFDTLGRLILNDRVTSGMLWTTRWMSDEDAANSIWYGLDPKNNIMPSGRAVAIWGQFVYDTDRKSTRLNSSHYS